MAKITHIAVHHAGGTQANPRASMEHITSAQVNAYHKQRWNFPSKYIPGQYGGYNFMYLPMTREIHQFRALGEETAAQIGWNKTAASIMIGGNYTVGSPDMMQSYIEEDITKFILGLIENPYQYVVAPDTEFDLSITRVHPHRWYQSSTQCYGSSLTDDWIRNLLSTYKKDVHNTGDLVERKKLLQQLLSLYMQLLSILNEKDAKIKGAFGSPFDNKSCEGFINLT